MIWKTVVTFFLDKIYAVVVSSFKNFIANWKLKKRVKKKIKDISEEKDPKKKARRINDLLGS